MKITNLIGFLTVFFIATSSAFAASIEKATMLNDHGLINESKAELIEVIFGRNDSIKPEAYYLLGSIAFDENKISVALDSWRTLSEKYPASEHAKLVKDRISELAEIVGETAKVSIDNAVALSYLRHGDFWSRGKDNKFTIDSSWITQVSAAVKWYDKVISEFPQSTASRVAYEDKLRTLLGWEEPGRYGTKHGVKSLFDIYMPQVIQTFNEFETAHPTASSLQGFRYQIAQAYWKNKNWEKTREWLDVIINVAGEGDSFYKDLAQRRLEKVEY